jgi:hypothetical protein
MPSELLRLVPNEVMEALREDPIEASFSTVATAIAFRSRKVPRPSGRQLTRIGAAEVAKWLSGHVLPGQDTLIDAPHLALLYPSLLGRSRKHGRVSKLCIVDPEGDLPLDLQPIDDARFRPTYWLDRPAWWTEPILENPELLENQRPWDKAPLGYAFSEDTSWFHAADDLTPFESLGAFSRRYVHRPDNGVAYEPGRRLLPQAEE